MTEVNTGAVVALDILAAAEPPHTEAQHFVAEHMLQLGFEMLNDDGTVYGCTLNQVLALLAARTAKTGWVDVRDRLPEPDVEVLTRYRHPGGEWEVGQTYHDPEDVGTPSDFGCAGWLYGSAENVETSHWMPLPSIDINVPQLSAGTKGAKSTPDPLGCNACTHPECGRFDGPRSVECRAMADNACARKDTTPPAVMPAAPSDAEIEDAAERHKLFMSAAGFVFEREELRAFTNDILALSQTMRPQAEHPAGDIPPISDAERGLTDAERRMLNTLFSNMDLSDAEWRNHGFRRATFDRLESRLRSLNYSVRPQAEPAAGQEQVGAVPVIDAREPHDEALMKLSQFAHTAAHMSENDMRNNLSSIADQLIALASREEAPEAAGAIDAREQELRWIGWGCQYPGKLPRLYGAKEIAELNCDYKNGDRLLCLASPEEAPATPQAGAGATSDGLHVGESDFEGWFSQKDMAHIGTKQLARDAYAAGMSDPLTQPTTVQQTVPGKYRKKPVVVDAYQLPAAGAAVEASFEEWCERVGFENFASGRDETLEIDTLEGTMTAQPGDWVIKGVKGEFYPCKPDVFAATYEAVSASPVR